MNGENSDNKPEDGSDYHLYPYSYDENDSDKISTYPESDNTVVENRETVSNETETWKKEEKTDPGTTMKNEDTETGRENEVNHTGPRKEPVSVPEKKSRKWQYIAIVTALILIIGGTFAIIYGSINGELYSSNDKVAVIYVQGTLITSSIPGGLGYVSSEEVSDNIRKALKDEDVKAIVLRVNSGGGSSTAGEEIYTEVKKASDSGVPVIVSMGDVGASAAYHLSAPADLIVANPSTMTGSIGTIWTFQNLSGFYEGEGVEYYIVKSGEFKDMGGSWRGLSDDEKEYANKVVAEVYGNFVRDVAEGRDMSVSEVKSLADGRIYTGREAKELGLVDEFGNLYDAIDMAAEIGEIDGDPTIVYMNKPSISSLLFGSSSEASGTATEEYLRYYEESPYGQIE
ncbi:MAG: signal peptide peptidase SppA [Methanolobus sp.]